MKYFLILLVAFSSINAKEVNISWSKDEVILLMSTYVKIRPNYDANNPEIKKLSDFLRQNSKLSQNSIYRDTKNIYYNMILLQRLDEKNNKDIRKIFRPTRLQIEVWNEYKDDLKKLKNDAEISAKNIQNNKNKPIEFTESKVESNKGIKKTEKIKSKNSKNK